MNTDRNEILAELVPIFREVIEDDDMELTEADTSETVDGWDSLAHILLISEIETAFGIKVPMGRIQGMKTVKSMIDTIIELQKE